MNIRDKIDTIYEEILQIRRHLHMYPDLSEQESSTAAYICSLLDQWNITYQSGIAENGVAAVIGNPKNASCIGLRADIDALPVTEETDLPYASKVSGVMHACGHDMHTAILLGVAKILKSEEDTLNALNGCVKLFFQPAEETVGGANPMIKGGCLENPKVDKMLALHVDPTLPTGSIAVKYGPMNAAAAEFFIEVTGKSCHGAHPEGGIDAIVMASQLVLSLQTISSRFTSPTTPVIVTVGTIHGGTQSNIVSGSVTLSGTLRTLDAETTTRSKALIEQIASGTAASFGGSARISWDESPFPPLINDNHVTAVLEQTARKILGDNHVTVMPEASMGADDFAFFTQAVPGSYFNLGVTAEGQEVFPLHNEHFSPDESAMKTGIEVLTATSLELL